MPDHEHYLRVVTALGLDDLMTELDEVSGEVYALVSPSVRLARWEDGHPERRSRTQPMGKRWWSVLHDENHKAWHGDGATRDEARAAALDQAEAPAAVEGGAQ